jgi:flavin-binding protein dodecin
MRKASTYKNIQVIINLEQANTEAVQKALERAKRRTKLN